MSTNYSKVYSKKLKDELKKVTNTKAKRFLLQKGYSSSSFRMPDYYQPFGLLDIRLDRIKWNDKKKFPKITKSLDILTPKGSLSWRSFNFINPYVFVQIVNELTWKKNWEHVIQLLTQETLVHSYSVPVLSLEKRKTLNGTSISNWLQMAEKDLIKDSVDYKYLTVTDIKNFYPSVYTHSISWAVHGKEIVKTKRDDFSLLGNKLDKLFQSSRDGQTNGIPIGSLVSDIIAEVILTDIDKKLSKVLIECKLKNHVLITRFRDDYRILSKTEDQSKRTLHYLNRILNSEYDLTLNSDKTVMYDDIIEGSFRPWMLELKRSHILRKILYGNMVYCTNSSHLKDCLIETYKIQKQYPNGRACVVILSKLSDGLYKKSSKLKLSTDDAIVIISILRKLTLLREEVTPQVYILLDILLKQIATKKEKNRVLAQVQKVISGNNDKEYQLIWFYRLCLSHAIEMCDGLLTKNNLRASLKNKKVY